MEIKGKTAKKMACVGMLVDQFENKEPSMMRIDGYMIGLSDLSDEAVEAATSRLLRDWKGMRAPAPADIREAATGTTGADLEKEVGQIVEQLESIFHGPGGGRYSSHILPARSMWVVQYLGGLQTLSDLSDDEWAWMRKSDIPKALAICPLHPDVTHIPGLLEQSPDPAQYKLINHVKGTTLLLKSGEELALMEAQK